MNKGRESDKVRELEAFLKELKSYEKILLRKEKPSESQIRYRDSLRNNLVRKYAQLSSLITELTGKDKDTDIIYEFGKPRSVNIWSMGLRQEFDYRTTETLSACIDGTNSVIGKLEDDIEKGIRDKQGKVIQKYEILRVGTPESQVTPPRFRTHTLGYIVEILADHTDTDLRNFFFKYNLLDVYQQSGRLTAKKRKVNDVFQHLYAVGDESTARTLDSIVKETLRRMTYTRRQSEEGAWKQFSRQFPELDTALRADGYQVRDGELIPVISPTVEPAKEEGLVEKLLDKYGFTIAKNHLEQSYDNYLDGNWEAANGALRSFLQDVFDQIALIFWAEDADKKEPGGERRKLLQNKGFIESDTEAKLVSSFFNFASYSGSHPGISSESDCRLRRYIAIALASYYLEKLGELHVKNL